MSVEYRAGYPKFIHRFGASGRAYRIYTKRQYDRRMRRRMPSRTNR